MDILTENIIEKDTADWISPPGDTIMDLIKDCGLTLSEVATRLGFKYVIQLKQLIKGEIPLTYDIAQRLEQVFGASAEFWMNREIQYRQRLAKQKG